MNLIKLQPIYFDSHLWSDDEAYKVLSAPDTETPPFYIWDGNKAFSTIDGAFTMSLQSGYASNIRYITQTPLSNEDPDCADSFYLILPNNAPVLV